MLKPFAIIAFLFATTLVIAQDFDSDEETSPQAQPARPRREARRPTCGEFAFGQGCMAFSIGPSIGAINSQVAIGGYGILSYFMVDRLALEGRGGGVFSSDQNNYHVGPAMTYYVGPFSGYLFNVSYSISRDFFTGKIGAEGWSYGPWAGLMTNLVGRVYWGIAVGYTTYQIEGFRESQWQWSPVVFIPF